MELSDAHKSRIASASLLFVLSVISIAAILFWAYPRVPASFTFVVAKASTWAYPVGLGVLAAWLIRYRWEGLLAFLLSGIVFFVLAIRMKGLLVYPGTFEDWQFSATGFNLRIGVMVLVGFLVGGGWSLIKPRSQEGASKIAYTSALRSIWVVATVLCAVAIYLTLFEGPPNQTFAPNQPIGIAIVWAGASIGVLATRMIEHNDRIDAALRQSMR